MDIFKECDVLPRQLPIGRGRGGVCIPIDADIRDAFSYCERLARHHYENFPVASLFIPRERRPFVYALYAFARTADDFADEGSAPARERLSRLDDWQCKLDACYEGKADHPVFIALGETARRTGVPRELFADLLSAFRLDVTKKRFADFREILAYCSCSANPVGRLVLHIFEGANPRTMSLSDSICTGLQLANFYQDLSLDWQKGRLYIPLEDLDRFGYTEYDIECGTTGPAFRELMAFEVERARGYLAAGRPLVREAVKELRFELALTVRGGMAILDAVTKTGEDLLRRRPSLSILDKATIVLSALIDRSI